jgi:hypothetical protein
MCANSNVSWMRRWKARQLSSCSRSWAAVLLTRCAVCESFQKSGAAIWFSRSVSWDALETKSKTLQELGDGFLCVCQAIDQILHGSSKM